jgi:amidase
MTELCDLSAIEARRLIGAKAISPVELMESCIARIEAVNPTVNCVVAHDFERARIEAKRAEKDVVNGAELGPLHGLPVGIKDLEVTAGLTTTWGSLLFKDNVPDTDQRSVSEIRFAGAIVLAKTNTPEFGAGANTTNRLYGATGNPFDPKLTCGGSSGGSAVALATGMMPLASGSDYGGSLRIPAGFCGVVGFRPSPGRVPNETRVVGLNPYSVLGPMGRTVADAALLLGVQADDDPRDPFTRTFDPELLTPLPELDLSTLRVAISEDLGVATIDNDIRKVFQGRVAGFRHVFAEAEDRDPGFDDDLHEAFEIIRATNFLAQHRERLQTQREKLGPNVIANTERGLKYSAADVAWANTQQTRYYHNFIELMREVDILISPVNSVSPFPHDKLYMDEINGEKMPTYLRWLAPCYALTLTTPAACSLPCGVDHKGMPFGIQISGPNGSDRFVLAVAAALERLLAANPETARPLPDIAALSKGA